MNSDVISIIKNAETQSNELYAQKQEEAKAAIGSARAEAKKVSDAKKAACMSECQNRLEEAKRQAQSSVEQLQGDSSAQCKALENVATQNMQKSIDYILERVVG